MKRSIVFLIFINIRTTFFRLFEWLKIIKRYYLREFKFAIIDFQLVLNYLLKTPHQVSKAFLKKRGEKNIYAFGETPLTTLDRIAKESRMVSKDIVFELGCGSGRSCFWLNAFVKCRVVGVDYLPLFIQRAEKIRKSHALAQVEFICADMRQIDLQTATIIYLYGSCLADHLIYQLIDRFSQLAPGTKVITVSYPLTDYSHQFTVTKEFIGRFPWGKAVIFINEKL